LKENTRREGRWSELREPPHSKRGLIREERGTRRGGGGVGGGGGGGGGALPGGFHLLLIEEENFHESRCDLPTHYKGRGLSSQWLKKKNFLLSGGDYYVLEMRRLKGKSREA